MKNQDGRVQYWFKKLSGTNKLSVIFNLFLMAKITFLSF